MAKNKQARLKYVKLSYQYEADGTEYAVSLGEGSNATLTGDTSVLEGNGGTVRIIPNTGYKIPSSVVAANVTGATFSSYNSNTGDVSFTNVTSAVTISVVCPALSTFTISVTKTGCTFTGSTSIQEKDGVVELSFTASEGYALPNSVTVSNATQSWSTANAGATGTLNLSNATGNVSVTVTATTITLSSITISGQTTSFIYGHEFTHADLVVTAHYSNGAERDVTNSASVSEPNVFNTSAQTITVSYTESGSTKEATYSVTFSNKTEKAAGWSRVTSTSTLLAGGTFIFGHEATANSGVIIPMRNYGDATTSSAGLLYSGVRPDGNDSSNSNTINMATVSSTSDYELTVTPSTKVDDAINIKIGNNYVGNTDTKNNLKLFTDEAKTTAFTPTMLTNDKVQLRIDENESYYDLQYNSGSPRYAVYAGTQNDPVAYVHTDPVVKELVRLEASYTGATKYAGDEVSVSDFTAYKTYDTGSSSRTQITGDSLSNLTITSETRLVQGDNTITLSYTESNITKTASVVYNAAPRSATVESIELIQGENVKTSYILGDDPVAWDLTDLSVRTNWSEGDPTSVLLKTLVDAEEATLSPSAPTIGINSLTVTYTVSGKSLTNNVVSVTVKNKEVDSLTWNVGENFKYSAYKGDKIDIENIGSFTAHWDNDTETNPEYNDEGVTFGLYSLSNAEYNLEKNITDVSLYEYAASDNGLYLGVSYGGENAVLSTALTITDWRSVNGKVSGVYDFSDSENTGSDISKSRMDEKFISSGLDSAPSITFDTVTDGNASGGDGTTSGCLKFGKKSGSGSITFNFGTAIIEKVKVTLRNWNGTSETSTVSFNGGTSYNGGNGTYASCEETFASLQSEIIITVVSRGFIQKIEFTTSSNAQIGKTTDCLGLESFINTNLHMTDYTSSQGWCKDNTHHYYSTAKTAFNALNLHQRALFTGNSAYTAEYARLCAWARANGESLNAQTQFGINTSNPILLTTKNTSATIIIVVISAISVAAIGGYFLFRKKKEK